MNRASLEETVAAQLKASETFAAAVMSIAEETGIGPAPLGSATIEPRYLADNQHVRQLCGNVARQTLLNWRERQRFPEPLKTPHVAGDLWDVRAVREWWSVFQSR